MSSVKASNLREKVLSGLLMFILGFVGFSILGAIILVILISQGILPAI